MKKNYKLKPRDYQALSIPVCEGVRVLSTAVIADTTSTDLVPSMEAKIMQIQEGPAELSVGICETCDHVHIRLHYFTLDKTVLFTMDEVTINAFVNMLRNPTPKEIIDKGLDGSVSPELTERMKALRDLKPGDEIPACFTEYHAD